MEDKRGLLLLEVVAVDVTEVRRGTQDGTGEGATREEAPPRKEEDGDEVGATSERIPPPLRLWRRLCTTHIQNTHTHTPHPNEHQHISVA